MLNREKHRLILFQILKDIFEDDFSKYIAFKWWTACYFLHWLDRFSTDLDFDLINKDIEIEDKIISKLKKYWEIKKWNKIILSYSKDDDNIKVDLNRNIRKNNEYETINFYWTDIKVQTKSTIFANKLVALIERNTNRDIYDVYFFFKNKWEINEKIIIERTWKNKKELFKTIENKLKNLPINYKILDWLWEVLDPKQKTFVKEKLVKELLWVIEFNLAF
jgi:predicted nucleotidyltransferase component of viral defense system